MSTIVTHPAGGSRNHGISDFREILPVEFSWVRCSWFGNQGYGL